MKTVATISATGANDAVTAIPNRRVRLLVAAARQTPDSAANTTIQIVQ